MTTTFFFPARRASAALALETAGIPGRAAIEKLQRLNRFFERAAHKPLAALKADRQFHDALLAPCPNARLRNLIARQKLLVRRYELLYFRQAQFFERSAEQHSGIIAALSKKDMQGAKNGLKDNWTCALDLLLWSVRS